MRTRLLIPTGLLVAALLVPAGDAHAHPRPDAKGVGLGVAVGFDYQRGVGIDGSVDVGTNQSFAWGFFVDIPLLETFYITPAAMLYEIDLGDGKQAVTDVDINFKFIVPLGRARVGAGFIAGLTTGLGDYLGHYGGLGFFSFKLVSNLDAFAMVQFKRLAHGSVNYDNIHGYLGAMFIF
ncbi:MAG: hypothetical protein V3T05_07190 [Myxococcota bacterium]